MNASTMMIGACRPTAITTNPMVAARLYAGATDAIAITVLDISPSALAFRPFSRMSYPELAWLSSTLIDYLPVTYVGRWSPRRRPRLSLEVFVAKPGRHGDPLDRSTRQLR